MQLVSFFLFLCDVVLWHVIVYVLEIGSVRAYSKLWSFVACTEMQDQSVAIIREIGVECGGSNVQFAVNPKDGEVMVIEMNPRVSRSSALASKATGFPIAKMAAKLSVGYTLDQIPNDITKKTPASFEPSIDYVVTKVQPSPPNKFYAL